MEDSNEEIDIDGMDEEAQQIAHLALSSPAPSPIPVEALPQRERRITKRRPRVRSFLI
jgi:hypothetical protein